MKKAICAVIALVMCMTLVFTGCGKKTGGSVEDASGANGVVVDNGLGTKSDLKIVQGETVSQSDLGAEIDMFQNGTFYMTGTIYSGDMGMPLVLASNGKDVQMTTTVESIGISVLVLDGVSYMIQPDGKQYMALDKKLLSAVGMEDFDVTEFTDFGKNGLDSGDNGSETQYAVTINGEAGLCTEYKTSDSMIKLYSQGDKLIQVDSYGSDGKLTTQIVVSSITSTIPADQLTLKGLTKASSVYSMFKSIIKDAQ